MSTENVFKVLAYLFFLSGVFFASYLRRSQTVHVSDFQAGLRFKRSGSYEILAPGSYRTNAARNPITLVDLRPRQFLIERVHFQDALLATAVISVSGEFFVSDPETANNSLKNLFDDSLTIIREQLCPAAKHGMIDPSPEGREKLALRIKAEINRTLQSSGMLIRNLEITELWVHHPEIAPQTMTN